MLDALRTHELIGAFDQVETPSSFLKYRYFNEEITYNTYDILAEYRQRTKRAAPFVMERHNGIPVNRGGYDLKTFTPPTVHLRRTLTIDDLEKKGFGEALYPQLSEEERQDALMLDDLKELDDMIIRREEIMCADVMLYNKVTARGYADDLATYEESTIKFYSEPTNPATLSVSPQWDVNGCDIYANLYSAVQMKTKLGQPVEDFLASPDVMPVLMKDTTIQKYLDIRNFSLGDIDPKLEAMGVCLWGRLNVGGHLINLLSYDQSYENDSGVDTLYIPSGYGVLAHKGAGLSTYGRVALVEESDGKMHFYPNKRVPKYISDARANTREIHLNSRPLMIPKGKNPFVVMQVC